MYIEKLRLRNFRCFGDVAEEFTFDPTLTAVVGANGAGKTAIITALMKLFGTRVEDRRLTREDVHFGRHEEPGPPNAEDAAFEELDSLNDEALAPPAPPPARGKFPDDLAEMLGEVASGQVGLPASPLPVLAVSERQVEIEVTLAFPELESPDAGDAVAEIFKAMSAAGPGEPLKARIRLEATWTYGSDDDDISSRIFWITTLDDVPFGDKDISKLPFSAADRRRFEMRYLPATRDGNAILRLALRELLVWLEKFGDWSGGREPMAKQWEGLQAIFDDMPAISKVTGELAANWGRLFEGPHLRSPRLTILAREIQRALRELSLTLGPGPSGRHRPVHDLSEGQASLFYVALVITLFKLDAELAKTKVEGFRQVEAVRPWLTLLAIEEPENHLAPFYLSRMVNLLKEQAAAEGVMAVLTTHSASALRRVKPEQVRHVRQDMTSLTSRVRRIELPPKTSDAYKFIQEAVHSHPELYFARLVILGEGRSEEMVLPRVARALDSDMELDPSFVAFVPLGGRHVNHFWRLLNGLQIPYLTLLDYDLGRHGGGARRLRYAVEQLRELGLPDMPAPKTAHQWDALPEADLAAKRGWLRARGVFYSEALDLDMMMLQAFPGAYGEVADVNPESIRGDAYLQTVFGESGANVAAYPAGTAPSDLQQAQYAALFKGGSKPVAHVEALSRLDNAAIKAGAPEPLQALFERCGVLLAPGAA
ncbi:ATP-dependent nuclease [Brevundimonas sp. TWP3-1-2b1]|uniref:ATP-dependent nuclease n=1 Tax=Brevundimonas sp. TWP3-1-2b1 TaxID=2804650 RepID=UPI003CEC5355